MNLETMMETGMNALARLTAKKPEQDLMAAAASVASVAFSEPDGVLYGEYVVRTVKRANPGDPVVVCNASIRGRTSTATQMRIVNDYRDDMDGTTVGPPTSAIMFLAMMKYRELLAAGETLIVDNKK
ncbi:hypothetical protein [Burkholderia sp. SRS-W-2-2016]|uniref:hypothetical protein n=1 Tax=Burkholderia sp. SRS-W-2-2016 TaxID=1926878 RepID=UPI001180E74A|nr:hypothetical protein [Burkholderia sp. SRS-W-2-2016]